MRPRNDPRIAAALPGSYADIAAATGLAMEGVKSAIKRLVAEGKVREAARRGAHGVKRWHAVPGATFAPPARVDKNEKAMLRNRRARHLRLLEVVPELPGKASDIAARLGLPDQNVSQRLSVMRRLGIVDISGPYQLGRGHSGPVWVLRADADLSLLEAGAPLPKPAPARKATAQTKREDCTVMQAKMKPASWLSALGV